MTDRKYKSAKALEMAVKAAAKKSGQDVGKAMEAYYAGRFLERVFSEPNPAFVLKGGRGMLARTANARYTVDTDFLSRAMTIDEALEELKRVAAIDLDDYLDFQFISTSPIAIEQEYREGCRVAFSTRLGGTKKLNNVLIDLVVDEAPIEKPDIVTPASRLNIAGIPVFDYHVYPVANAVTDKICATMQNYNNGRSSSRIKDLVDLAVYATSERIDGSVLSKCIKLETQTRRLERIDEFRVPNLWLEKRWEASFSKSAKEAKLPESLTTVKAAEALVKSCVDPAIKEEVDDLFWNPTNLAWE